MVGILGGGEGPGGLSGGSVGVVGSRGWRCRGVRGLGVVGFGVIGRVF